MERRGFEGWHAQSQEEDQVSSQHRFGFHPENQIIKCITQKPYLKENEVRFAL
jgi:hypothetical protein